MRAVRFARSEIAESRSCGPEMGGAVSGPAGRCPASDSMTPCTVRIVESMTSSPVSARPVESLINASKRVGMGLERIRQDVINGLNGAAETGCLLTDDGLSGQKRGDGRLQVCLVVGILRKFEIVDRAAIKQLAVPIDHERARRLLREPLAGDRAGRVVQNRKRQFSFPRDCSNLIRGLSIPRGDRDQPQFGTALAEAI